MELIIRNNSGQPIYDQISGQIKAQILSGALSPGDALPSIRGLAKDLKISVITTKRAYEELEREGFLTTVPGKGCFVAPQNPELVREDTLRRAEVTRNAATTPSIYAEKLPICCGIRYSTDIIPI